MCIIAQRRGGDETFDFLLAIPMDEGESLSSDRAECNKEHAGKKF